MKNLDQQTLWLLVFIGGALVIASIVAFFISRRVTTDAGRKTVENLVDRIKAWWVMCAIFTVALIVGPLGSVLLFAVSSFLALREFRSLFGFKKHAPSFEGALLIACWLGQYYLIAIKWYGLFSILIPVYAFLLYPIVITMSGTSSPFLERVSKGQWSLMIAVYCISHAPGLLMLDIPGYSGNAKLLFFLTVVTQGSDVLQYTFGKLFGRRKIAPSISPNKTWEGFIGGTLSASVLGAALYWATPFSPWQAALISLLMTLLGFAGGLTMSAVKRDYGTKDYGSSIKGHGGVMDRLDSIAFAAPIYFHVIRFFFAVA